MNAIIIILSFLVQFAAHGCFAAHTPVTLPTGEFIAIKDIQVGDKVVCHDGKNGYVSQEVVAIQSHQVHDCVCVILDNAHIITAHNQKFYLADHKRWKIAGYLQPGDRLLGKSGQIILVKYVLKIPRSVRLYDLTVKEYRNFLVSKHGIVAHNFVPAVAVGVSIAFGSGAVELAGITLGIGALTLGLSGLVSWLNNRREEQEFWKMDPIPIPNAQQVPQDCVSIKDCSFHNTENSLGEALKTTIADSVTQTAIKYASNKWNRKAQEKEDGEVLAIAKKKRDDDECPHHVGCKKNIHLGYMKMPVIIIGIV